MGGPPDSFAKASDVNRKFAHIIQPGNDKVHTKAAALLKETTHYDTKSSLTEQIWNLANLTPSCYNHVC